MSTIIPIFSNLYYNTSSCDIFLNAFKILQSPASIILGTQLTNIYKISSSLNFILTPLLANEKIISKSHAFSK